MNDDQLRLSDRERDAAAADLGEHYAQGRLSAEEHDERLSAVWAAKTRGELPRVFADLPSAFARPVAPPTPAYVAPTRGRAVARGFHRLPPALRVVVAVLLAVVVLTHLPFVLMAGLIWFVVARHHGRPAVHSGWQQGWQRGWQPRHHWR